MASAIFLDGIAGPFPVLFQQTLHLLNEFPVPLHADAPEGIPGRVYNGYRHVGVGLVLLGKELVTGQLGRDGQGDYRRQEDGHYRKECTLHCCMGVDDGLDYLS